MRNRAGMQRSPAPREPGDRKVEAAPEEMHRARFSKKGGTKMREHLVRAQQRAPESIGVIAVVSRMCRIPIKRDCVDYFIRYLVDEHVYAELGQGVEIFAVELSHGHRPQHQLAGMTIRAAQPQDMIHEIEFDLKVSF